MYLKSSSLNFIHAAHMFSDLLFYLNSLEVNLSPIYFQFPKLQISKIWAEAVSIWFLFTRNRAVLLQSDLKLKKLFYL